jgi:hypothetical protein
MVYGFAIMNGHDDVLHWARASGCPEDEPNEDGSDGGRL